MKKTANLILLSILFFAGVSFAMKPMGFICGDSEYGENWEYYYQCSLRQFSSDEKDAAIASGWNVYDTWGEFESELNMSLTSAGNADSLVVYFESNFDLDGLSVSGNDTSCVMDDFVPLSFSMASKTVYVHGNNHKIENFCYINEDDGSNATSPVKASFFSGNDIVSIKNLKLDNAYVKVASTINPSKNSYYASIVYDVASGSLTLSDIQIKKSRIVVSVPSGSVGVGALVGYAGVGYGLRILKTDVDVDIYTDNPSTLYAGALLGFVDASSGEGSYSGVHIVGNVSRGDLIAPSGKKLGYVVGGLGYADTLRIWSNYHLGTRDVNVTSAIGLLLNPGGTESTDWRGGQGGEVRYNYRSTAKSGGTTLDADGTFGSTGNGVIEVQGANSESWYNGVIEDSLMKTRLFAYVMNEGIDGYLSIVRASGNDIFWENGNDGYLEMSEDRTAYRMAIDLSTIFDLLTEDDKDVIAGNMAQGVRLVLQEPEIYYYAFDFTERDRRLSRDFVEKMAALSVDYAVKYESSIELASLELFGNMEAKTVHNYSFKVSYEAVDPEISANEVIVPLEQAVSDMLFVWPKIDNVKMYGAKGVVPPVLSMSDEDKYYLQKAVIKCRTDVEDNDNCNDVDFSVDPTLQSFAHVMEGLSESFESGLFDPAIYTDTVHLVYSTVESVLPTVNFENLSKKTTIRVTGYGYDNSGEMAKEITSIVGTSDGSNVNRKMMSKFALAVEAGFALEKWTVDFMASELDFFAMERCYTGVVSEDEENCSRIEEHDGVAPYVASADSIQDVLNGDVEWNAVLKWSFEMNADDMLDMDSVATALARMQSYGNAYNFLVYLKPELSAIPYTVNFNMNAEGRSVFIDDSWPISDVYSREDDITAQFPKPYSTTACFDGWGEKASRPEYKTDMLDAGILNAADHGENAFSLYAQWIDVEGNGEVCDHIDESVMILTALDKQGNQGDYGDVVLWQSYGNPDNPVRIEHEFVSVSSLPGILDGHDLGILPWQDRNGIAGAIAEGLNATDKAMMIPVSENTMTFHVYSRPKEGYGLAGLSLVSVYYNEDDGESQRDSFDLTLDFLDTMFTIMPAANMEYGLYARFGRVVYVGLDLNGDRENVFYGNHSMGNRLAVVEGGSVFMPGLIYTSDACVLGWSLQPSGESSYFRAYERFESDELLEKLGDDKLIYAIWDDADQCVEYAGYNRVHLETEHGTLQLLEIVLDGDSSVEYVHSFAKDLTMLMPYEMYGSEWVLRAVPDKGYKLDSAEIVAHIKDKGRLVDTLFVLTDGESLPQLFSEYPGTLMDANFKAYFSEDTADVSDTLKWVRHEFAQSGNAVRLILEASELVSRKASLQVALTDLQGVVLDSVTYSSSYATWSKHPLLPGSYVLHAQLFDELDTIPYDTSFTVKAEIAIEADAWQMVSLSDVEQDSIRWDGDPLFYWWNESVMLGDFWKYEKYRGGDVEGPRGFWYSSLEGRSLMLRRDSATDGEEFEWKLDSGWTIMANPYGWGVWLSAESEDSLEICKWYADRSGYGDVFRLEPYEAVWVYSDTKKVVRFNAEPAFVDDEWLENERHHLDKRDALAKAVSRDDWTIQAVLSDSKGHIDSWNVLGVGEVKERLEPPTGMGDYVNLSVMDGKKALAKSIKRADEGGYEWNLALDASTDRVGFLKFEGVESLNEIGLRVYVTVDGKTTEMRAGDSLKVLLKAAGSTATVRVSASEIRTVASKLENLRFERVPGALQVGFDVTEDLAGSPYKVQLVDLNGKVAATYSAKALAGHNMLSLTAPKSGLYLLRVTVGGHHAVRKIAISR